jgi:DNA-binding GntR family transcriptional regulator
MSRSAFDSDPRLYVQISDVLRGQIENGTLKAGKPMLSLGEVARSFVVSRQTAQRAMQVLVDERLVWLVPGLGYFVCESA